jgi:glycosyltransferase involved in cell wall biosynthesis
LPEGITVVVMAYAEAGSLAAVVSELRETLVPLGRPYEIVIIDDGSPDATGEVADRLASQSSCTRVVHHTANQGLGGVYRSGFSEAREDLLTFFPADGQFPATIIQQFLPLVDGYDFVLGYLPSSGRPRLARFLSWSERMLYRTLFGSMPRFQGILMFRRAILDRIPLVSTGRGWAVLLELLLRAQRAGCRTRSVPIAMRPRMSGASKVQNVRTIVSNLGQALALRRRL